MGNSKSKSTDACACACLSLSLTAPAVSETIWSHFWLSQGRDVKTLGNLLGGLGGCFDRFFPRPWALGSRLGTTQQPRFRLPRKAQAHPQRPAQPCHAMHLPCGLPDPPARGYIWLLIRLLCHSLRRRYPKCSVRRLRVSLCLLVSALPVLPCPLVPSFAPPVPPRAD